LITVEFKLETPRITVADMSGCAHAAAFGIVGALTFDQERELIGAAMAALEARQRAQDEDDGQQDRRRCS